MAEDENKAVHKLQLHQANHGVLTMMAGVKDGLVKPINEMMSSVALLVAELQSLSSETKRKQPEIRDAAERALSLLRSKDVNMDHLRADSSPVLLQPISLSFPTKSQKIIGVALTALQRLIALRLLPSSAVPGLLTHLSSAVAMGVDIQLRLLQTIVALLTGMPEVSGFELGDSLLLCFRMQESKIAVVSSTAAATLRQLVMFVFDKMQDETKTGGEVRARREVELPNGENYEMGPASHDAYQIFLDLCLLANSEKPNFLRLDFLHKTFALELVESVLSNYSGLFRAHTPLLLILQHNVSPLLLKHLSPSTISSSSSLLSPSTTSFSSTNPIFPLTLRCTRVTFLLLKQFLPQLEMECEVFLSLLVRLVDDGISDDVKGRSASGAAPTWMRVLAMEVIRGLCSDAALVRAIWERYDGKKDGTTPLITPLLSTLVKLLSSKHAASQLGTYAALSRTAAAPSSSGNMLSDVAASVVASVSSASSPSAALSTNTSGMRVQCIDQLDKADAPSIPPAYPYLLAIQSLLSLFDGFWAYAGSTYRDTVVLRANGKAPAAFPDSDLDKDKELRVLKDMLSSAHSQLHTALALIVPANLSTELFLAVLESAQNLVQSTAVLGLDSERDAFLALLATYFIPAEDDGSYGAGLTDERSLALLSSYLSTLTSLSGTLAHASWLPVLRLLWSADYLISLSLASTLSSPGGVPASPTGLGRRTSLIPSSTSASTSAGGGAIKDVEPQKLIEGIQRVFDASRNFVDDAFEGFVRALCLVDQETLLPSPPPSDSDAEAESYAALRAHPTFGLTKLNSVALSNIARLLYRSPAVAWDPVTEHLLAVVLAPQQQQTVSAALLSPGTSPFSPPLTGGSTSSAQGAGGGGMQSIKVQAARVLDDILISVPRTLSNTVSAPEDADEEEDIRIVVQRRVLEVLKRQVVVRSPADEGETDVGMTELRKMGLETLHHILQASGHTLLVGWEVIFEMLSSVCYSSISTAAQPVFPPSSTITSPGKGPPKRLPHSRSASMSMTNLTTGALTLTPQDKLLLPLLKQAFQSLTLVCDSFLSSLSPPHLKLAIGTLGQFGKEADTNIALTAAASLLWSVSDVVMGRRKAASTKPVSETESGEEEEEYSRLWLFLLQQVLGLCTDDRPQVRDGAIQTLFRTMSLYGSTLSLEMWEECVWRVGFVLLERLSSEIARAFGAPPSSAATAGFSAIPESAVVGEEEKSEQRSWSDSKTLAIQSLSGIWGEFTKTKLVRLGSWEKAWDVYVGHMQTSVLEDERSVVGSMGLRAVEKGINAFAGALLAAERKVESEEAEKDDAIGKDTMRNMSREVSERVWKMIDAVGSSVLEEEGRESKKREVTAGVYTQDNLVAFVDVVSTARKFAKDAEGADREWELERITRMMTILKGLISYSKSTDYRPDVDNMTPVQTSVTATISSISLSVSGVPSLVLSDLAEYATLPFTASFVLPSSSSATRTNTEREKERKITYIALIRKVMPWLVDLFERFKDEGSIYQDGTIERVLSAYLVPIKLKYDCPAPAKFAKDIDPLWKTATRSFLRIVKECAPRISGISDLRGERVEGIWSKMIDVYKGGILADCSHADAFPLDVRDAEEKFDRALITSLETDVVPNIGEARVPDILVAQLADVLSKGSRIYHFEGEFAAEGTTDPGKLVERERFSYWCFDLLFLICSDASSDGDHARQRVAVLGIRSLLKRCKVTMQSYIGDQAIRGSLPFPRARDDELVYVLRKMLQLRLWPGSLWAAQSDRPSEYSIEQPPINSDLKGRDLISDAMKRSNVAHLYELYHPLCQIAAMPQKTYPTWIMTPPDSRASSPIKAYTSEEVIEVDPKSLAKGCLRVVGEEMGMYA